MNLKDKNRFATRNEGGVGKAAGNPINHHHAQTKRGIGIFPDYKTTEKALMELKDIGYGMDRVSIIGQNSEHLNQSGQTGNAQGQSAQDSATMFTGGAIRGDAGGLMGGLVGLGIPEKRAKMYNDRVSAGEYLVMVDSTHAEIGQVEALVNHRGIREWGIYDVPTTESATARTDAESVKLHEERLVVDKNRQKIGEVGIGKHVETETMQVSTPVEKEHVVLVSIPGDGKEVATSTGDPFNDQQETARVEVFEETPNIHKETFVREEIGIAKKATQETVNTKETLRREELDVDSQGRPIVDDHTNRPNQNRR